MQNLKTYFSYQKLKSKPYRILFLNKSYFLQLESIRCLKDMGHSVLKLDIVDDPKIMLELILKNCVEFKPDFIFGMNHLGFDPEGKITEVLNTFNIPVVFWYLDDFRFIIFNNTKLVKPNTIIFSFEQQNIEHLKKLGFQQVYYLPSATAVNPDKNYSNPEYKYLNNKIVFVGNSFEETKKRWQKDGYNKFLEQLNSTEFFSHQNQSIIDYVKKYQNNCFEKEMDLLHYSGYVASHFTQSYRKNIIRKLIEKDSAVQIFGDQKWKDFELDITLNQPVHNLEIAPKIFAESDINLNISSVQLQSAVNLRVFDVPAAAGFLITDWKDDLANLFDVDKEVVTYKTEEELINKIKFYKTHRHLKQDIINRALNRIKSEHLLQHRIIKMLDMVEKVFK